ncbi:MAG: hypothetical protein J5J00_00160 [Deltaproteobacteria bacterium]|nr:hypothetical protein [Deltaproteobacteria bacterium]
MKHTFTRHVKRLTHPFVISVLALAAPVLPAQALDSEDYFPLAENNTWSSSLGYETVVTSVEELGDLFIYRVALENLAGYYGVNRTADPSQSGLYLAGLEFNGNVYPYDTPVRILRKEFQIGDTLSGSTMVEGPPGITLVNTYISEVLDQEDVQLESGVVLKSVIKIGLRTIVERNGAPFSDSTSHAWLAPGIGQVGSDEADSGSGIFTPEVTRALIFYTSGRKRTQLFDSPVMLAGREGVFVVHYMDDTENNIGQVQYLDGSYTQFDLYYPYTSVARFQRDYNAASQLIAEREYNSDGQEVKIGDVNEDGLVNRTDVAILVGNFGKQSGATRSQGDLNGDGVVSLLDLAIVQRNLSS